MPGITAGFPILLDDNMRIIEPAFAYLIEHCTILGRSRGSETVRTYAEHLDDWFDTLEQSCLDWRAADEITIAAYRNRMLEAPSPHTKRPYARSTVNDRIRTVCRFYDWAHRRSLIDERPFRFVEVRIVGTGRDGRILAHLDRRPASNMRVNAMTVAEYERLPRPLRVDELRRLFAKLDPPYRLMAEWALSTGMRRMELCGLAISQLPHVANLDADNDPLVGVPLAITKGDRPRTIYPPAYRPDPVVCGRGTRGVGEVRATTLFELPAATEPVPQSRRQCRFTRARLSAAFNAAFQATGLRGSLHWLRHTFAMTMLVRLQRRLVIAPDHDLNPLKVVQVLLGHASIATTSIYLRCVELHERELSESLAYLYGELIPDDDA